MPMDQLVEWLTHRDEQGLERRFYRGVAVRPWEKMGESASGMSGAESLRDNAEDTMHQAVLDVGMGNPTQPGRLAALKAALNLRRFKATIFFQHTVTCSNGSG